MTETILTIGIPTSAVFFGILLNRNDANRLDARITTEIGSISSDLRSEIGSIRSDLRSEIGSIRSDLRSEIGAVRAEIAAARQQSHDDIMMLAGISREHEARISRLESNS